MCEGDNYFVLVLLHAWSYLLQIARHIASFRPLPVDLFDLIRAWRASDELAVDQVKGKVNYTICKQMPLVELSGMRKLSNYLPFADHSALE